MLQSIHRYNLHITLLKTLSIHFCSFNICIKIQKMHLSNPLVLIKYPNECAFYMITIIILCSFVICVAICKNVCSSEKTTCRVCIEEKKTKPGLRFHLFLFVSIHVYETKIEKITKRLKKSLQQ